MEDTPSNDSKMLKRPLDSDQLVEAHSNQPISFTEVTTKSEIDEPAAKRIKTEEISKSERVKGVVPVKSE